MKQRIFNVFISLMVMGLALLQVHDHLNRDKPKEIEFTVVEQPEFFSKSPEEGLMEALIYYDVKYPNIVYAQAVLETGHFKSRISKEYNNLFGLYNSKVGDYHKFNHWSESILAYIDMVEYKYIQGDYYTFLKELPYASDPNYINKVKRIESNLPPLYELRLCK